MKLTDYHKKKLKQVETIIQQADEDLADWMGSFLIELKTKSHEEGYNQAVSKYENKINEVANRYWKDGFYQGNRTKKIIVRKEIDDRGAFERASDFIFGG